MSASNFEELQKHIGHKIICVAYGNNEINWNVAIECETCDEILFGYDNETQTILPLDNASFNRKS